MNSLFCSFNAYKIKVSRKGLAIHLDCVVVALYTINVQKSSTLNLLLHIKIPIFWACMYMNFLMGHIWALLWIQSRGIHFCCYPTVLIGNIVGMLKTLMRDLLKTLIRVRLTMLEARARPLEGVHEFLLLLAERGERTHLCLMNFEKIHKLRFPYIFMEWFVGPMRDWIGMILA